MAAPTMPTLLSLATEGLKRAGYISPTADQLTRAQDEWMNEIKNDISVLFGGKKIEFLQAERVLALTDGLQKYSQPTDYFSNLSMQILDGSIQGIAQAGAATTITLAATETVTSSEMVGSEIVVTGGTGVNQIRQCTSYDESTKIATISPAWTVNPAVASTYMVVSSYSYIESTPIWDLAKSSTNAERGLPRDWFPIGDDDNGEFLLLPLPYRNETGKVYVLKQRYYADLMELDLTGTLMGTLYKRWRNVWVQGVYARALQSCGDNNTAGIEAKKYSSMVSAMVSHERYGADLSNLQIQISDY
jgi:hypothetical protein